MCLHQQWRLLARWGLVVLVRGRVKVGMSRRFAITSGIVDLLRRCDVATVDRYGRGVFEDSASAGGGLEIELDPHDLSQFVG